MNNNASEQASRAREKTIFKSLCGDGFRFCQALRAKKARRSESEEAELEGKGMMWVWHT